MTYEHYVGLALNVGRVRSGHTFAMFQGVKLAFSRGDLPASLFEGVAGSSDEARELAFEANVARATARAMAGMVK